MYGPVRTAVWEDGGREAPSYPIISTTDTLPGGACTVTIAGFGGGGVALLDVRVQATEPQSELEATPDTMNLTRDGAENLTISAVGLYGESDPVHLEPPPRAGLGPWRRHVPARCERDAVGYRHAVGRTRRLRSARRRQRWRERV